MSLFRAMTYPVRGLVYLFKHTELWGYAIWAFVTNFIVFSALLVAFYLGFDAIVATLTPDNLPGWLSWMKGAMPWLVGGLVIALAATLGLLLFTIVGNAIAGPFLEAMTAKMLANLGEPAPPPRSFAGALGRSLLNQALKLLIFGTIQAALLTCLVTPAAVIHPFLAGALTIFFLALEYWDYPLEGRGLLVPQRLKYLFAHPGAAVGFGAVSWLILLVPLLGYFMLPASVCAATLLVHDLDRSGRAD
jgi:CysZ protein